MKNKQDGRGKAEYVQETEESIRHLGPGGKGSHGSLSDAQVRGVTGALPTKASTGSGDAQDQAAGPRGGGPSSPKDATSG
jgi:hypothetical protein